MSGELQLVIDEATLPDLNGARPKGRLPYRDVMLEPVAGDLHRARIETPTGLGPACGDGG
ncbi:MULTISPECIES: hypothetical protein [Nocardioides]|uniref:Uncharacterized protein n=1 Tax=Nocardioides vastitatis TaxID=2568655 RepID=A0ABW0ZLU6_9ACTN|nr:hypothetical protein [Nocardioides sp.]